MSIIILSSWRKQREMAQLSDLVAKASELRILNNEIERRENDLIALKEQQSALSEHIIPKMMAELKIDEFKLSGNFKVTVKDHYFGKILGMEGYKWLKEQGFGDIVKAKLEIPYDFTDPGTIEIIKKLAEKQGFMVINNTSVHHMTLGAFLREQTKAGLEFPPDKITVYPGKKTTVS